MRGLRFYSRSKKNRVEYHWKYDRRLRHNRPSVSKTVCIKSQRSLPRKPCILRSLMTLVTGALVFQTSSVRSVVKQRMHKYFLYGDVTSWDAKILGELENLIDRRIQRSRWPVGLRRVSLKKNILSVNLDIRKRLRYSGHPFLAVQRGKLRARNSALKDAVLIR